MTTFTATTSTAAAAACPEIFRRIPYRSQQQQQLTTRFFIVFPAIVGIILAIANNDVVHAKSPFDEAKLSQIRTDCRQQTKPQPTDAEYKLITENKLLNAGTTSATTPKSLQYYCLWYLKAAGVFTANAAPNTEFLGERLPALVSKQSTKQKTDELIEKCGKPTGADDCEKAFNFVHCMAKEAKIYFY